MRIAASVVALLLLSPSWLFAQRGPYQISHIAIRPSSAPDGMKPSEILNRRMMENQLPPVMSQLDNTNALSPDALALINTPFAHELLKQLATGKDQELLQLADRELLRQKPELRLQMSNEERLQAIKDAAAGRLRDPIATAHPADVTPFNPPPVTERERLTSRAHQENIMEILRSYGLDNVASDLRDSPVFKEWIRDLSRASAQSPNGPVTVGNLADIARSMDGLVKDFRHWLPRNVPDMPKLDFSPPSPSFSVPSLYSPAASSFSLSGSGWTFVAFGLVVLLAALALGRLGKLRPVKSLAVSRPFILGPWPVDPQHISSREELIAAFEYLALLKYGLAAKSWHHNEVAAKLGDAGTRNDAESLARLYERARYSRRTDGPWESARQLFARLTTAA